MSIHHKTSPVALISSHLTHRELLWELVKRDFIGRYQGSLLGIVWSFVNPLLLLVIYTLVFSVAFKAKWGGGDESKIAFAIILFSGIIIHSFFSECLIRAPILIVSHTNYVKKLLFPIEILPSMVLLATLLQFIVSFGILLVFSLSVGIDVQGSALLIPIALIPLILMTLGISWILASLGVYLRDLAQAMTFITTAALFLAPIFYRIEALPETYRDLLAWNPITLPVIQLRNLLLWDKPFLWGAWAVSLAIGVSICQIGYWWFQKSRHGFADVL